MEADAFARTASVPSVTEAGSLVEWDGGGPVDGRLLDRKGKSYLTE